MMELADKQRGIQAKLEPIEKTAPLEAVDLFMVPCVKAFRDNPIPPGKRHLSYAKNIAVLYRQVKGSFEGFRNFAEELVRNQEAFKVGDVTGWESWAVEPGRKLNCEELRRFLLAYVPDFTCEGCPIVGRGPSILELIQRETEKPKDVELHPVIGYHEKTGLHYGTLLQESSQILIISAEKVFTVDSETLKNRGLFANNRSVSGARISVFHQNYSDKCFSVLWNF
ncbi:MAG: hypothetical protein QMD10_10150 [Desulfitobacteriaceae bacterium]|nr:hypothetical protein [Desulfitobacteriaceae bacterium]